MQEFCLLTASTRSAPLRVAHTRIAVARAGRVARVGSAWAVRGGARVGLVVWCLCALNYERRVAVGAINNVDVRPEWARGRLRAARIAWVERRSYVDPWKKTIADGWNRYPSRPLHGNRGVGEARGRATQSSRFHGRGRVDWTLQKRRADLVLVPSLEVLRGDSTLRWPTARAEALEVGPDRIAPLRVLVELHDDGIQKLAARFHTV